MNILDATQHTDPCLCGRRKSLGSRWKLCCLFPTLSGKKQPTRKPTTQKSCTHPKTKPKQRLEKPKTSNQTIVNFRVSVTTVIIWQVIFFFKKGTLKHFEMCLLALTLNDDRLFIDKISLKTINVIDPFQPANDGIQVFIYT